MKKHRIGTVVLSLAVCAQTVCMIPAEAAVSIADCGLDAFAEQVQALAENDEGTDFFDALVFDPSAGTLTAVDGEAQDACCGLRVEDGILTVQSGGGFVPFTDAPDAYGYQASVNNGAVTLTNEFQTARLIVKAKGSIDTLGAQTAAEGYRDLHILQYETPAQAYAAYQVYAEDSRIEYVQPSHHIVLDDPSDAPAEDAPAEKEHMTWGADLIGTDDFTEEYLKDKELPEVKVAVIDTGLNDIPALFEGRILDSGINVSNSGDDTIQDDLYHGTHVTGTICELTPENVKILPVKVFDYEGTACDEQIYLGVMYALEQGADILNMSFGGLGVYPLEVEAITAAEEQDVICCAAAGNNGDVAAYFYPGGIDSCITVGAVDQDMSRASFSNTGDLVDVVAPGMNVLSYVLGSEGEKEYKNGTSMAAPHVSACCALLRSYDKSMLPQRAEALLRLNAADIGDPGFDADFGWGFVNMKDFRWDDGICKAPAFSKKSGNFGKPQTIELETETEGAAIYYTTDGTVPDPENGTLYTEPLTISETTQILAIAVKDGFITSVPSEAVYRISGKNVSDAFMAENGVLTHCRSVQADTVVPDTLNGEPVTAVADGAFAGNHFVRNVTLPDTVRTLGNRAFAECTQLETITAKGVSEIGAEAFAGDPALKSTEFAAEITAVGASAFENCVLLKALSLPGVTAVPASLCAGCAKLESILIPDAVSFGEAAFSGCFALKEITADWQHTTAIGSSAFAGCRVWKGDLSFPALERVGAEAFSGDRLLLRVSFPERITALAEGVFADCSGLRLLQLPGVTSLGDSALALGSSRSDLETEICWEQLTDVGANALRGVMIGTAYETVCFSALETLQPESFAGVSGGALAFPKVKAVPEAAFDGASVIAVYFEHAETLASGSLKGCRAAVISAEMQEIAADAYTENTWFVSPDPIPLPPPEEAEVNYRFCSEPLVMRYSTLVQSVPAHGSAPCAVLVCGTDLTYQWYRVSGDDQTPIEGETAYLLYPDTFAAGEYSYACVVTDAGGETETVQFNVVVTDAEEYESPEEGGACTKAGTEKQYTAITVPADGTYRIVVSGAAPVTGMLTDAAGKPVAVLHPELSGISVLTAELRADSTYLLSTAGKWDGSYTVRCTADIQELCSLSDCTLTAEKHGRAIYGQEYHPVVTLTAPDGTVLQEGVDYTVMLTYRNQYCTVSVFGTGAYSGYAEAVLALYPYVPEDTPVPVSLTASGDSAVYCYIPRTTGKYYFYATYGSGFAEEVARYCRAGRYPSSAVYAPIRTTCTVSDKYDGTGTVLARNSSSVKTGNFFNSSVTLYAGQPYYFICTSTTAAEYALVVSAEPPLDISKATVTAGAYAVYEEGKAYAPKVKVKMNGELLTEGVDYQVLNMDSDKPGTAQIIVYGMGRYISSVTRSYEIIYSEPDVPETLTEIDTPVTLNCLNNRIETVWFETTTAVRDNDTVRYRVINERVSGGYMVYQLYQYDPLSGSVSMVTPMKGEKNDYKLRNGIYCIVVSRQYADQACTARFTVMQPYDLSSTELVFEDAPYTGAPVSVPLKVITEDGRELERNRDYIVSYPYENIMFGETEFVITETNRSYGRNAGKFNIYVDLPEDVPELTLGEHTAHLTLDDRLAVYKLTPETDMHYVLASSDVPENVLRIFTPEAEMLNQVYGSGAKALTFTVPAGETRYIMVKFNSQNREGSIRFTLGTETRLLTDCETETVPQLWTGEQIAPNIVFRDGDYTLQEGVDYKLRYTTDDVNIGTATANYTGIGKYFGICDVGYEIIAPDVTAIEDIESVPLLLGQPFSLEAKEDDQVYILAHYAPGIQTDLKIRCYDAQCRLTMQLYSADGTFIDSRADRTEAEAEVSLEAGETVYILFALTDVSSTNRKFKVILNDTGNTDMKLYEDKENGVFYRISESRGYAEAYALRSQDTEKPAPVVLQPEISGLTVSYVPEGLFYSMPKKTIVIGYAGCSAAEYADQYGFIYLENGAGSDVLGDLNGDGRCSAADTVVLQALLAESELLVPELVLTANADCSGDGVVDFLDYAVLLASTGP